MKVGLAVSMGLATIACASGEATPFDGNDDQHCSVLMFHSVRLETPTAGGRVPKDFALSAWYNKKIGNRPDPAKAAPILKAAGTNFETARPAIQQCTARAKRDPNFEPFEREAIAAWEQAAKKGAAAE